MRTGIPPNWGRSITASRHLAPMPKVIDMVIEAVSAGELDKVLKAALGERRVKLRQVS